MDMLTTIPNFKKCMSAFHSYMLKTYNLNVSSVIDIKREELLYSTMKEIQGNPQYKLYGLNELNNMALNKLKDAYVEKLNLNKQTKPCVHKLEREKNVFGNRSVFIQQNVPQNTNDGTINEQVQKSFEALVNSRSDDIIGKHLHVAPNDGYGLIENAMNVDDFMKKLSDFELERDRFVSITQMPANKDPKALYEQENNVQASNVNLAHVDLEPVNYAQQEICKDVGKIIQVEHYFVVNGFDRDWAMHPLRNKFTINCTQFSTKYKNIASIRFTSLIIPTDINEEQTIVCKPRSLVYNDNKLVVPYILLQIDEIQDLYDGLNQQVQKAHTVFVFDTSYKVRNGRGFIIMRPIQNEVKDYTPNMLSTLQHLTFNILKPTGALYNMNKDNYNVCKVDYTTYNDKYLQIVLDKYFDRNEFYQGDIVLFKNFNFNLRSEGDQQQNLIMLNNFLNKPEGHEILQIGEANESGFTNNFFIHVPYVLDQQKGKLVLNKNLLDAIRYFNDMHIFNPQNPARYGDIINTSLQNVLTFTITENVKDSSLLTRNLK